MIIVNHSPFEDDRDMKIETILDRTALMELEEFGLDGMILKDMPPEIRPDLKITGRYRLRQDILELRYSLQEASTGKKISEIQISTPVTHFLDRDVADAVRELLHKGNDEIDRIARATQEQSTQEPAPQGDKTAAVIEREDRKAEPDPGAEQLPRRVEAEARGSGTHMLGRSSEYLPYGLLLEGRISYPLVEGEKMVWRLGASAGVIRFSSAVDYKAGYIKTLVPLGVLTELRLRKKTGLMYRVWWTAGAALRPSYQDEVVDELLAPALPYTGMGIGVLVPFTSERFGLSAGLSGMGLFHLYEDSAGGEVHLEALLGINLDLGIVWRM